MLAFIVHPIIAALIGAGTNELALWMVLHKMLPNKKPQLAQSVQDIVANEFMSPESIRDQIDDEQVAVMLYEAVYESATEFLGRELPSMEELATGHEQVLDSLAMQLRDLILEELTHKASDTNFRDELLKPFIVKQWEAVKGHSPQSLFSIQDEQFGNFISAWIMSLYSSNSLQNAFRSVLNTWLDNKLDSASSLQDLLPKDIRETIESYATSQSPVVIDYLIGILQDDSVQDRLSQVILEQIKSSLSKDKGIKGVIGDIAGLMVGIFPAEQYVRDICASLPNKIREHFAQPENLKDFTQIFTTAVTSVLERPIPDEFVAPEKRKQIVSTVFDAIWTQETFGEISLRSKAKGIEYISKNVGETLSRIGIGEAADAFADGLADKLQGVIASERTQEAISAQFTIMFQEWKKKPIGKLGRFVSEQTVQKLCQTTSNEIRALLRLKLSTWINKSGAWDMISRKIIEYDNEEIAGLIQRLARKELRNITYLGGILGAILGVLQAFISHYGIL